MAQAWSWVHLGSNRKFESLDDIETLWRAVGLQASQTLEG